MLEEAITIVAIIGGSAAAAWYAKKKFQPEIERSLEKESPALTKEAVYRKPKDPQ